MDIFLTAAGTVRISVTGEFTAEELTQLMHRLADARAIVADDAHSPVGLCLPTVVEPSWHTQFHEGSLDSMLVFRHPGFGWIAYVLPPHHRMRLATYLLAQQQACMEAALSPRAVPTEEPATNPTGELSSTTVH